MRLLVACPACKRQHDASRLQVASLFRCHCGEKIRVPVVRARDATVVRCSSCGAARRDDDASCRFCGASFTLHERDLNTICAHCMSRVGQAARYCHHCGAPIAPEGRAGEPTNHRCPACPGFQKLTSRRLGQDELSVLECPGCAGLWLGREAFRVVADRVRVAAESDGGRGRPAGGASSASGRSRRGKLYRRCPVCDRTMHRNNYGRKSGVIVDRCRDHGTWFDAEELERILSWIRGGGEGRARALEREEARHSSSAQAPRSPRPAVEGWRAYPGMAAGERPGLLEQLLGSLFDLPV